MTLLVMVSKLYLILPILGSCILSTQLLLIHGFSFKDEFLNLETKVEVRDNIDITRYVNFNEKYSRDQKRSLISYLVYLDKSSELTTTNIYHFDATKSLGLILEPLSRTCYKSDLEITYDYMFPNFPYKLLFEEIDLLGIDKHIVGFSAKILYLIQQKSAKLELAERKTEFKIQIRNHEIIEYSLAIGIKNGQKVKLWVTFDAAIVKGHPKDHRDWLKSEIPLQIYLSYDKTSSALLIDYYNQHLDSDKLRLINTAAKLSDQYEDVLIDVFAFPLVHCPYLELTDQKKDDDIFDKLANRKSNEVKFSFSTEFQSLVGKNKIEKRFVAFDGSLFNLRIETRKDVMVPNENGELERSPIDSLNIYDLNQNRRYFSTTSDRSGIKKMLVGAGEFKDQAFIYDRQCSTVTALPEKELLNNLNERLGLLHLLFGINTKSKNLEINYLGRALVRGIKAFVYEAQNTVFPFWFDEPLIYTNKDSTIGKLLKSDEKIKDEYDQNNGTIHVTTIYISAEDIDLDKMRLLKIQIHERSRNSKIKKIFDANIFDFIWQLSDSISGVKANELFSLIDHCSINKFAEINLLLESADDKSDGHSDGSWLDEPTERNQALLFALSKELFLRSTMVQNIESRFNGISEKEGDKRITGPLLATVRVAEQASILLTIEFIGYGYVASDSDDQDLIYVDEAKSAAECLMMSSNNQRPTFVFLTKVRNMKGGCILDRTLMNRYDLKITDSKKFKLSEVIRDGMFFRVEPKPDDQLRMSNVWFNSVQFQYLENREIVLRQASNNNSPVPLRIRRIYVKTINRPNTKVTGGKQEETESSSKPLSGFSLDPESASTNHFEFADADDDQIMNPQQCQAICLSNFECQAYSFCLTSSLKFQCLTTNYALTSPDLRKQLNLAASLKLRKGSKITLKLEEDETIDLVRDSKCEIRNKYYLDLFNNKQLVQTFVRGYHPYPVNDQEQCAKICWTKGLESIRASLDLGKQISRILASANDDNDVRPQINELKSNYSRSKKSFCKSILFIESHGLDVNKLKYLKFISKKQTNINDGPKATQNQEDSFGYCILPDEWDDSGHADGSNNFVTQVLFSAVKYQLDFSTLYEKRTGIGLKMTQLGQAETSAYFDMNVGKTVSEENYKLLQRSISNGHNFQFKVVEDVTLCALQCLLQSTGLWPSCRSFDIVREHRSIQDSVITYCLLNTISLNGKTEQEEIVRDSNKSSVQYWHYEPIYGFAREESKIDYQIQISDLNESQLSIKSNQGNSLEWLIVSMVIMMGLISGIFLGIKVAQIYTNNSSGGVLRASDLTLNRLVDQIHRSSLT